MAVEIKAEFLGRRIAFNYFAQESKLYIEGKVVDSRKGGIAKNVALVRGAITEADTTHIVEVTYNGLWKGSWFVLTIDGTELARAQLR